MISTSLVIEKEDLQCAIHDMDGWAFSAFSHILFRRFSFQSFQDAFTWMAGIAQFSVRKCHHPDWRNVDKYVEVTLWTQDVGGVTKKDIELANYMSQQYRKVNGR